MFSTAGRAKVISVLRALRDVNHALVHRGTQNNSNALRPVHGTFCKCILMLECVKCNKINTYF